MKTILTMASTFPRWKNDTTPSFVHGLSRRLANKYRKILVLAPHSENASKHEFLDGLEVYRFQYFYPSGLQRLAYGAGIIPNAISSFAAKLNIPFFLLSEYIAAKKLIDKYKPDIIHAHWIVPQGILAAFAKINKSKLIVSVHGSDLFPLKNSLFKSLQRAALKNCDACTVNSEATKNEIIRRFSEYKNKVRVIPMGVDTRLFSKRNVKSKFKDYSNQKIVLFTGRLNEQKGIEYLIKSMTIVNKKIRNARLLIIGEGEYRNEMQKLADSLRVKNIEFIGSVPHQKLADYYNLADVFVLPAVTSRIGTEGQGLVLLEAMACGTAVIGTKTGGIKFIIKNIQNGLLARERDESDLAENIIKVISDSRLRQKLSKNGIEFVRQNYSWETIVKKFDKLYRELE